MTRNTRIGGAGTVRVLPDVTGLDKQFDYTLPEQLHNAAAVGSIVRVPLHGRRVRGWVTAVDPALEVDPSRLHPVLAVSSIGPDPALIDLAEWACDPLGGRPAPPVSRSGKSAANVTAFPPPAHEQVEMPRSSVGVRAS